MKRHIGTILSLAFLCVLLVVSLLPAQDREISQQEIEKGLRQYTPQQIDARLREMGLTREEAFAKAREKGIPLEQFLSATTSQDTVKLPVAPTRGVVVEKEPERVAPIIPAAEEIPGFAGRSGTHALKPFGYNIFNYPASTFEPLVDIPTPPDYVVGPNDQLILTLWGETQLYHELVVNRDGAFVIPNVGRVLVQGLTLEQVRKQLLRRMTAVYAGLKQGAPDATTHLDVSLGKLRTIQMFILGEVNRPGGYQLSSVATALTALYYAGGPSIRGSLRSVQVRRQHGVSAPVDFYDFALKGDKSSDVRLQDGDIVFVPPVGKRIALAAVVTQPTVADTTVRDTTSRVDIPTAVNRPAIYELQPGESLGDLLKLAGGLRFDADYKRIHVERVVPFEERQKHKYNVLDIDVNFQSVQDALESPFELKDGDVITVRSVDDKKENMLTIEGPVVRPGRFALREGMHVRDLILAAEGVYPTAFVERGSIIRTHPNGKREILPFNVSMSLEGEAAHNIELQNLDHVSIYPEDRFFPQHTVEIAGTVRVPGMYTRFQGMTIADLLVLAGGLTEEASLQAEVSRVSRQGESSLAQAIRLELSQEYWNVQNPNNFVLEDFDRVFIPKNPEFQKPLWVSVTGRVRYPGSYAIRFKGEKLCSFLRRAGGLASDAYLKGGRLVRRLNNAGLVPVDFEKSMSDSTSRENVEILEGDEIIVPENLKVVLVRGEVATPAAALHRNGAGLKYYLEQAGGLTDEADDERIVVTLPNGQKWAPSGFFLVPDPDILAGSTVFVPKKIEKKSEVLATIREITGILSSAAAIIVAVVVLSRQ